MSVRHATPRDLPAIVRIYNQAVATTTATFDLQPVTLEQRRAWFRQFDVDHPLLVDAVDDQVLGYAYYLPYRAKPGYATTKELSVYVEQAARGRGSGTGLVQALLSRAADRGVHVMVAVIGGDNPASTTMHHKLGFEEVGRLREVGYKFGRWLDTTFMQRRMP